MCTYPNRNLFPPQVVCALHLFWDLFYSHMRKYLYHSSWRMCKSCIATVAILERTLENKRKQSKGMQRKRYVHGLCCTQHTIVQVFALCTIVAHRADAPLSQETATECLSDRVPAFYWQAWLMVLSMVLCKYEYSRAVAVESRACALQP